MLAGLHRGQRKAETALKNGIQAARDVLVLYLLLVNIPLLPCLGCKMKIKPMGKLCLLKHLALFFFPSGLLHSLGAEAENIRLKLPPHQTKMQKNQRKTY